MFVGLHKFDFAEASGFHKSSSAPQLPSESTKRMGKYEKDDSWDPDHMKKQSSHEKKNPLKIYSSEGEEDAEEVNIKVKKGIFFKIIISSFQQLLISYLFSIPAAF